MFASHILFLRYSALNNGVTMKSRLEVNQVTHTGSIRKLGYAFYLLSVLFLCFCVHHVFGVYYYVCAPSCLK